MKIFSAVFNSEGCFNPNVYYILMILTLIPCGGYKDGIRYYFFVIISEVLEVSH